MCVHNAIHEKSSEILKDLLKSAFFVMQAKYYLENQKYIHKRQILMQHVSPEEKEILLIYSENKYINNLDSVSEKLINWASDLICQLS